MRNAGLDVAQAGKKKKKLGHGVITNKSDLKVLWKHTLMYPCNVVMVSLVFMGNWLPVIANCTQSRRTA